MRFRQWSWWKTERPVMYLSGLVGEVAVVKGRREAWERGMREVAYSVGGVSPSGLLWKRVGGGVHLR